MSIFAKTGNDEIGVFRDYIMKKFDFRLNKVLDHRENRRKESKEELAQRNNELQAIVNQINFITGEQDKLAKRDTTSFNVSELLLSSGYQDKLLSKLNEQKVFEKKAESEVALARENYIAKSRDVKALEMLKSKKLDEYRVEVKRNERKILDEVAHRQR